MTVGRLRALTARLPSTVEIIVWDVDSEERKIAAIRIPDSVDEAAQLITEVYNG